MYHNSFLPSAIREWNSLPLDIRNSPSIALFKKYLNRLNKTVNSHFYYGDRKSQVLHARLRTKCSSLNYHLFSKNLIDSPRCQCGKLENNFHFFFECARYSDHRTVLLNTLSNICTVDLNTLLRGDDSKDAQTNILIFDAVFKYIKSTKRFN